ncbi:MAG: hypothetical protein V3U73_04135 [bacterium]
MKKISALLILLMIVIHLSCESGNQNSPLSLETAHWQPQDSRTKSSFRGLNVLSHDVAWASGSNGTYVRTVDGGFTWLQETVSGALFLDFRDVHAVDAKNAFLMSAGEGENSRIYKTTDGGKNWALQFMNSHQEGFFDGMAFWDADNGIVYGDPVDGRFFVIMTSDGGTSWNRVPPENIPPALSGEHAFAASGTGIAVFGENHVWFGTGGSAARVFRSTDRGQNWTVTNTPIISGEPSTGIFSLAFWDENHGIAVGGDYQKPGQSTANAAITNDGGQTWTLIEGSPPAGFRSCVACLPGATISSLIAIGTSGSDYSIDNGLTWAPLDTVGYNTAGFAPSGIAAWAVGAGGRIAKLHGAKN